MTIELTPEVEAMVRESLRQGPYRTVDELIAEAARLLLEEEHWFVKLRAEIAVRIEEGWSSAERGELIDGDQVRRNLEERKRGFLDQRRGS